MPHSKELADGKIILPAVVGGISSRVDGSFSIRLSTEALSPDQVNVLMTLLNKVCYVMIKEGEVLKSELDHMAKLEAKEFGTKTHSQRLRGVLYRRWEQDNKGFEKFDDYYHWAMELHIDHHKSFLES